MAKHVRNKTSKCNLYGSGAFLEGCILPGQHFLCHQFDNSSLKNFFSILKINGCKIQEFIYKRPNYYLYNRPTDVQSIINYGISF